MITLFSKRNQVSLLQRSPHSPCPTFLRLQQIKTANLRQKQTLSSKLIQGKQDYSMVSKFIPSIIYILPEVIFLDIKCQRCKIASCLLKKKGLVI